MARLFISFYLFIAASLIALAALLNSIFLSDAGQNDESLAPIVALLVQTQQRDPEHFVSTVQQTGWPSETIDTKALSLPIAQQQLLHQQGYIVLHDENNATQTYFQLSPSQLLRINIVQNSHEESFFWAYSGIFFLVLGALIAMWLWPLWRDLNALKTAAESLREDGSMQTIAWRPRAVTSSIANAFNQLANQVKQLLQTQRELSGAVAHELRTPLSRMKFALAGKVSERSWRDMQQDVDELERLVQEMLDYASMQSSTPELNFGAIPVNELVAHVQQKLRLPTHLTWHCAIAPSFIQGDSYFVERALQNIVGNALRYARTTVQLSSEQVGNALHIICDDDGPGVPDNERLRIFDAFYRPDQSRDRRRGGAGLGLAIVKRIQQWHDGDCWVSESPLGGARFILSFKLLKS